MHRTEGLNNDPSSGVNLFKDGPPGTIVEQEWLNSIQEELALVLADTGTAILTAATDTRNQLRIAIAKKWTDIASAATVDIANADGTYGDVTGVVTITSLGTVATGSTGLRRTIHHTGIHVLTHNAVSMINITGANITTAVGDISKWTSLGAGNWLMTGYSRADGAALTGVSGNKVVYLPPLNDETTVAWRNQVGFSGITLADGVTDGSACKWITPSNFNSLTSLIGIYRPQAGTGNLYIKFDGAAVDADGLTGDDTDSIAVAAIAVISNQFKFIDITAAWDGLTLSANHLITMRGEREGGNVSDTVGQLVSFFGCIVTYT